MEKINNIGMVSIGAYYACDRPLIGHLDGTASLSLDFYEERLQDRSLKVVGFWAPTRDHSMEFMRVVVDTSEIPAEDIPFMWMQIFLCKMDSNIRREWEIRWKKIQRDLLTSREEYIESTP